MALAVGFLNLGLVPVNRMKILERLASLEKKLAQIEAELSNPDVVKDQTRYQKLTKELASLRPIIQAFHEYQKVDKECADLTQLLGSKDTDAEMQQLYQEESRALSEKKKKLLEQIEEDLFKESDPNSNRNCIMEIRAGTGGEEASLFASDLYRMYDRFAVRHKLKTEILEGSTTGKGGFKEIIFSITGVGAYSWFKYESGIHRVQRVPETEASGRIHTSAVTVAVLAEADEKEVDINPADLRIDVYRASGAGGQHVNKTESAVRITHNPTGFVVSCQDERSQHKNKAKAMRVLRARIYDFIQQKQQKEIASQRKEQVGSGDRSGKIRTYNFPDQRVTDHRIGLTLHALDDILDGYLDDLVAAMVRDERDRKLADAN